MDASTLERSISDFSKSLSCLNGWLVGMTAIVVLGLLIEYVPELKDEWRKFSEAGGWKSLSKRQSQGSLAILLGAVLVTGGVAGEMTFEGLSFHKEGQLEIAHDHLEDFLRSQSQSAEISAKGAVADLREADGQLGVVTNQADALGKRLDVASSKLSELEDAVRIQGPRWIVLESHKNEFIDFLKPFATQKIIVLNCGLNPAPEPSRLEGDIYNFLGEYGAGWDAKDGHWNRCSNGGSWAGGNLIIFNPTTDKKTQTATKALSATLNKMGIATIGDGVEPAWLPSLRSFFGDDSPQVLALENPTSVVLLIGPNPMSNMASWVRPEHQRKPSTKR